jgi:hypothetical protein
LAKLGARIVLTCFSAVTACKILDDLIDIRLFREENQSWIEKAVITRIWIGTTNSLAENAMEQLQDLLDTVSRNTKTSLSAPATHAAQTVSGAWALRSHILLNYAKLLWKRVEAASTQEQFGVAELWCQICLHPVFEKAGAQNKAKVARSVLGKRKK